MDDCGISGVAIEDTGFGYTLSLIPIFDALCEWGERNRPVWNNSAPSAFESDGAI